MVSPRVAATSSKDIPAPEPDLTPQELIARAEALIPYLKSKAPEMEAARLLSHEAYQKVVDAGLLRVLQPRRWGGYEFDFVTWIRCACALTRGYGSMGWVYTFNSAHNYYVTFFPEQGQAELFGAAGNLSWPQVFQPTGTVTKAAGGYLLSGAWDYASGVTVSPFIGVVAVDPTDSTQPGGDPDVRMCIIPTAAVRIEDNWFTLGLRGTGSFRVHVKDLLVPDKFTLSLGDLSQRRNVPGWGTVDNPVYRTPELPVFLLEMGTVAVGLGQAALAFLDAHARTKKLSFPPFTPLHQVEKVHRRYSEAAARVDAAEALLLKLAQDQIARAERVDDPAGFPQLELRRVVLDAGQIIQLVAEAMDTVLVTAGSSAVREGHEFERIYRDFATLRTHYLLDYDRTWRNFGALNFGLDAPERV